MIGSRLADIAVLTATPDLLDQGLLPELLRTLAKRGIGVFAALPYAFTAAAAAELYRGRITHRRDSESRLHASWLNGRLFTGGSSLILYLRADAGNAPLSEEIAQIKGSSRIGDRPAGSLRDLSRITDRGFSLVHSPDDVEGVAHETGLLLGPSEIAALLDPERPLLDAGLVCTIIPYSPLRDEPNPFDILPRLLASLGAFFACSPQSGGETAGLALAREAGRVRRELSQWPIDKVLERRLWEAVASLGPSAAELEASQKTRLSTALAPAEWRRALANAALASCCVSATAETAFTIMECEALIAALAACDLPTSEWDRHRLRLIAAYHRPGAMRSHE